MSVENFEQPRLFEDANTRIGNLIESFHPRLGEALYRLAVEPEHHSFRAVAEEELEEIQACADEMGMSEAEFKAACKWVEANPWHDGDENEFTYIETDEGHDRYFGRYTFVIGQGQLPPGPESERHLMTLARVLT